MDGTFSQTSDGDQLPHITGYWTTFKVAGMRLCWSCQQAESCDVAGMHRLQNQVPAIGRLSAECVMLHQGSPGTGNIKRLYNTV